LVGSANPQNYFPQTSILGTDTVTIGIPDSEPSMLAERSRRMRGQSISMKLVINNNAVS
jgi:hypothetical protein